MCRGERVNRCSAHFRGNKRQIKAGTCGEKLPVYRSGLSALDKPQLGRQDAGLGMLPLLLRGRDEKSDLCLYGELLLRTGLASNDLAGAGRGEFPLTVLRVVVDLLRVRPQSHLLDPWR